MPGDGQLRRLLVWFRERKLIQVLAVYIGAGWVILQVTDIFIDKLDLPRWAFPATIVLLLIGLAIVIATAILEYGVPDTRAALASERSAAEGPAVATRRPRWWRIAAGGLIAFGALFVTSLLWRGFHPSEEPALVEPAGVPIAVLPFRTTGADLDVWGEGLMDVLSANLDGVGDLRAIDARTVLSRWRSRGGGETPTNTALAVARDLGARWAVTGQAVELGGRVRVDARIYGVDDGDVVASSTTLGPPDSILIVTEGLTLDLLRGLGREAGIGVGGRAFTGTSIGAVKAYLAGEQALRHSRWNEAIEDYQTALKEDSTFALAAVRLSLAYGWRDGAGSANALGASERARRFADRLAPRDRLLLEASDLLERGRVEAIDRALELTRRYPDDPEGWYQLGEGYYHVGFVRGLGHRDIIEAFDHVLALDSSLTTALVHSIESVAYTGDVERWDRYGRIYLRSDSTSDLARGLLAARALALSEAGGAEADLRDLSRPALWWGYRFLVGNLDWLDLEERILSELTAAHRSPAERAFSLWRIQAFYSLWRGRVSDAMAALDRAEALDPDLLGPDAIRMAAFANGVGDSVIAARAAGRRTGYPSGASWLIVPAWPANKAWYDLAVGDIRSAEHEIDRLRTVRDSLSAAGDSTFAVTAEGLALAIQGRIAAQRGDHRQAIALFRRAIPLAGGYGPLTAMVQATQLHLATSLAETGHDPEAVEILDGIENAPFIDATASFAAAQLHERLGEREAAIRAYARVVKLWADCDPALRPRVEAAQKALARLTTEQSRARSPTRSEASREAGRTP